MVQAIIPTLSGLSSDELFRRLLLPLSLLPLAEMPVPEVLEDTFTVLPMVEKATQLAVAVHISQQVWKALARSIEANWSGHAAQLRLVLDWMQPGSVIFRGVGWGRVGAWGGVGAPWRR